MTTHRERVESCLHGDIPDRPPVALWRHFPVDDQSPEDLAEAHLAFQRNYDFDIVKVTPASSFCLKDWGAMDVWEGNSEGTRRYSKHVITKPIDWEHLPTLEPSEPNLAGQLNCLRQIRKGLGTDTPLLQTIFNPLAQAKHLVAEDTLVVHLRQNPEAVTKGLEIITNTTRKFIEAALETGIDGIFYAVQHAQAALLTQDEFVRYSRSFDLTLLRSVKDLWCNMLHIHGGNIYFDILSKYPVNIINWHDRETAPSLSEAIKKFNGVLCGGLSRDSLVFKTRDEIKSEARDAIRQTNRKRLILSTGCVVPIVAPHGNIKAARQAVEQVQVA
jgi:uroporphyrinogen decarboxylase